jgi:hypothetical protein
VTGSRQTLSQRFVLDVVSRLPKGAGEEVLRLAYVAGETPRPAFTELEGYYRLCDRAKDWPSIGLSRLGLVDYANFLSRTRVLGVDGALAAELTLETTFRVLDTESFPTVLEPIARNARTAVYEARKAINFAVETTDPQIEHQNLRFGTEAASRAFVAAWGFFGSAPAEARTTVQAMLAAA